MKFQRELTQQIQKLYSSYCEIRTRYDYIQETVQLSVQSMEGPIDHKRRREDKIKFFGALWSKWTAAEIERLKGDLSKLRGAWISELAKVESKACTLHLAERDALISETRLELGL